jgi:DNA-directed RNA polymerase subunit RPC12/RpoP
MEIICSQCGRKYSVMDSQLINETDDGYCEHCSNWKHLKQKNYWLSLKNKIYGKSRAR